MEQQLKIFLIDDCDYVVAKSLSEAMDWYSHNVESDIEDAEEIIHEHAEALLVYMDEDHSKSISMADELRNRLKNGDKPPFILCSIEY